MIMLIFISNAEEDIIIMIMSEVIVYNTDTGIL